MLSKILFCLFPRFCFGIFGVDDALLLAGTEMAFSAASASSAEKGQKKANTDQMVFNAAEAQKQRDFEERMFGSRYQTTRKDLEAAGYNPLMALGLNPSVPMGASASAQPQSTTDTSSQIMSKSVNNATSAAALAPVIDRARSEAKTADAEARVSSIDADAYTKLPPWAIKLRAFLTAGNGIGGVLGGAGVAAGGAGQLLKQVAGAFQNSNDASTAGKIVSRARARVN